MERLTMYGGNGHYVCLDPIDVNQEYSRQNLQNVIDKLGKLEDQEEMKWPKTYALELTEKQMTVLYNLSRYDRKDPRLDIWEIWALREINLNGYHKPKITSVEFKWKRDRAREEFERCGEEPPDVQKLMRTWEERTRYFYDVEGVRL